MKKLAYALLFLITHPRASVDVLNDGYWIYTKVIEQQADIENLKRELHKTDRALYRVRGKLLGERAMLAELRERLRGRGVANEN